MGVLISKLLGWKIDLKHPKYEINIHLGDGTFTVGIPVTEIPLSKRSYIKHCGLRTTIAYIMFSLLDISPGNVVLDPMCGYATILIEASEVCQVCNVHVYYYIYYTIFLMRSLPVLNTYIIA